MQKTKTIQIRDRSFTLKELPVRIVRELVNGEDTKSWLDRCQKLLKLACPELDEEALLEMYPSEIEELWHGFEEVNSAFLGLVRLIGMDRVLIDVVRGAVATSIEQFASSLPVATGQKSGTTATVSS